MTMPLLTVTPSGVAQAYERVASVNPTGEGFGAALGQALQSVIGAGNQADAQAMQAIQGGGNITEVATAVSRAELALQSAVAIRDKVVQAYQDIMRMPI
jgi:flagellar hook-basal body complex protein FliE